MSLRKGNQAVSAPVPQGTRRRHIEAVGTRASRKLGFRQRSSEKFDGGGLRGSRVGGPKKVGSKSRVWDGSLGGYATHLGSGRLSVVQR